MKTKQFPLGIHQSRPRERETNNKSGSDRFTASDPVRCRRPTNLGSPCWLSSLAVLSVLAIITREIERMLFVYLSSSLVMQQQHKSHNVPWSPRFNK